MIFMREEFPRGAGTVLYRCKKNINPINIEYIFSSWQMETIISSIILMCTKVIIHQTLTSIHHYINYPTHRKLFLIL